MRTDRDYNPPTTGLVLNLSLGVVPTAAEKGGTADMNIGVGELQECTISKS